MPVMVHQHRAALYHTTLSVSTVMGCCQHTLSNIELRHCYTRPAPEHDNKSAQTLLALAEKASLLSNLATAVLWQVNTGKSLTVALGSVSMEGRAARAVFTI